MNGERFARRNFALGVANGALVNLGLAFVDPFTVLPVFITRLGGSSVLVGIATAAFSAGWFLPQAFVAREAQSRRFVLSIYTWMTLVRALSFAGAALLIFSVDPSRATLMAAGVIAFLALNNLSAGVAGVPFIELTSKTIPLETRGSFFGTRRFLGGIVGIFAGIAIAVILGDSPREAWNRGPVYDAVRGLVERAGLGGHGFPDTYGILFVIGGFFATVGMVALSFTKEPPAVAVHERRHLRDHFEDGLALLREKPNYRLYLLVRVCWQFTTMAFPFYSAYAFTVLGFEEGTIGVFVSVWVGSAVLSNFMWGRMTDRFGNRVVLVATAAISVAAPVALLLLRSTGATRTAFWVLCTVFLINGFARSGRFISDMTYMLEFAPRDQRPLYVGFMNTFSFPFMLSPIVGGLIVGYGSYAALFVVALLAATVNIVLSARLVEPRQSAGDGKIVPMPQ